MKKDRKKSIKNKTVTNKSKNKNFDTKQNANIIQRIKNINIKSVFRNIGNFIKNNQVFLLYVITALIQCILIRVFTLTNNFPIKATLFDLSVILIFGSLGYLFKTRGQYRYWIILLIIITVLNTVNGIYYLFFNNFTSFSLLSTVSQTFTVGDSIVSKISLRTFIYVILFIIFLLFAIYSKISKNNYSSKEITQNKNKKIKNILLVGVVLVIINSITLTGTDVSRIVKQWNREYIVERFGILVYQGNDLFQTVKTTVNSSFGKEKAAEEFVEYFSENTIEKSNNKYTNKLKNYNVVVIHLESIMQFLIGLKINGREVTPNLNKLVSESMYFDNFYSQVSVGTSSDAEFTLNTSLLPVQTGTVAVSYYDRTYMSLEKLLNEKKYYTFSMHGNKESMWNRGNLHKALGYKRFYSQTDYDMDEIIGLGLSDRSFFLQSEAKIKEINENVKKSKEYNNWMGTLLMLSNHTPFSDDYYLTGDDAFDVTYHTGKKDKNGKEIVYDYLLMEEMDTLGKYIRSSHYADKCLGEYIEYVKSHDEYKKTLFVMYGDHAAQINMSEFDAYVNYDFETGKIKTKNDPSFVTYDYYANELFKKVPLILWTTDGKLKGKYSYPMGMIDVLPTIGNMLGIYNKYALGHDIFETKNNNIVVFPNNNFLTNSVYYYAAKDKYQILNKGINLSSDYIEKRKEYSEKIIKISNDLIVFDLINYTSDKDK